MRLLLDSNVIVAAIKSGKRTATLKLLIELSEKDIQLIGNKYLAYEYGKMVERFPSDTAKAIIMKLIEKMEIVEPEKDLILKFKDYLPEGGYVDATLAATCFKAKAILITNDSDFDKLREEGIIEIWGISDAIRKFEVEIDN